MKKEGLFESLAKVVIAERISDFHHADVESRWFKDGSSEGPDVRYFGADGTDMGPPESYRPFSSKRSGNHRLPALS
jgi:hypothetical protein